MPAEFLPLLAAARMVHMSIAMNRRHEGVGVAEPRCQTGLCPRRDHRQQDRRLETFRDTHEPQQWRRVLDRVVVAPPEPRLPAPALELAQRGIQR